MMKVENPTCHQIDPLIHQMEVILSHEKGHRSKQGRFEEPGGEYVFQLSVDVFLNKSSVAS